MLLLILCQSIIKAPCTIAPTINKKKKTNKAQYQPVPMIKKNRKYKYKECHN